MNNIQRMKFKTDVCCVLMKTLFYLVPKNRTWFILNVCGVCVCVFHNACVKAQRQSWLLVLLPTLFLRQSLSSLPLYCVLQDSWPVSFWDILSLASYHVVGVLVLQTHTIASDFYMGFGHPNLSHQALWQILLPTETFPKPRKSYDFSLMRWYSFLGHTTKTVQSSADCATEPSVSWPL